MFTTSFSLLSLSDCLKTSDHVHENSENIFKYRLLFDKMLIDISLKFEVFSAQSDYFKDGSSV